MDFAQKLRELLDSTGMRAIELAKKTNISRSTISQYLSGAFLPKQQNIFKIAEAFNVSPSSLVIFNENNTDEFYCKESVSNYNHEAKKTLSAEEIELLTIFNKLDTDIAKGKAIARIEALVEQQEVAKANKRNKESKIKRSC